MSWIISSHSLEPDQLLVNESLFALANGYLGVRGNFEEGYAPSYQTIKGTYINAFHDIVDLSYGEKLYGFPETQQKLTNVIDAQGIEIFFGEDEERFSLFQGEVLAYERNLHLQKGFSERAIHWRSPAGKEVKIRFTRIVSFDYRELFAIRVEIIPINFFGSVKIISTVNGNVTNFVSKDDPRVNATHAHLMDTVQCQTLDHYSIVVNETKQSKLRVACVSGVRTEGGKTEIHIGDRSVTSITVIELDENAVFEKWNVYTDTLRHGADLAKKGLSVQQQLTDLTFKQLLTKQESYVSEFWKHADVLIHGDDRLQEGIRFNLYHLLQAAGRDPYSNIASKGLSGEGYEGHYFWDTEIYMIPVLTLTKPELAKNLLIYRYAHLDQAREHAKIMGHKQGVLYPWRTISGSECSAYYPSGSAQYHINADIAYSFVQYYLSTGDKEFLLDYGAEVLFETSRLWLDTGHFEKGEFRIDAVTGPDEYTCVVNNNYYTNVMAKFNLAWAVKVYDRLKSSHAEEFLKLKEKLNLQTSERDLWEKAAKAMYLPYDKKLGINPQDDSFLQKAVWDFEGTPKDHYPLLLHYHPLTLYRYQVCKQADTVLAHFLLEDEADLETIRNSYHYYENITTHDSSLSSCIFSIMAAKINEMKKAYHYFIETARLDLDNTHKNTKDGLHMANMGGTWMAIVFGFAGMRIKENGLFFEPRLPEQWEGYECKMQYRSRDILIKVTRDETVLTVKGDPLEVFVFNQAYAVTETDPLVLKNM